MTSSEPISDWITHRRPTEADGDGDGYVKVRLSPGSQAFLPLYWSYVGWSYVGEGVPWQHTGMWKPPAPAPTKPALAVGQVWRRRDGKLVTITWLDRGIRRVYPVWAGGHSYTPDGFWSHAAAPSSLDLTELISEPQQAKPTAPTPRKFAAISRTVHDLGHTLDAIADDGTAWCMTLITTDGELRTGWTQLPPLPAREIENE